MNTSVPLRVFLVEDEALIAMELEDIVEDLGHEVVALATSVETALQALQELAPAADAAIVDANLGGSLAAPVVAELRRRNVPTVLASGYSRSELSGIGFDGPMVSKPYTATHIQEALLACLGKDRDQSQIRTNRTWE
jgi:DNA-binding response OmpR family regulator